MQTGYESDSPVMRALPSGRTLMVEAVSGGRRMAMVEEESTMRSSGVIGRVMTPGRVAVDSLSCLIYTMALEAAQCSVCSKDGCRCLLPTQEKVP